MTVTAVTNSATDDRIDFRQPPVTLVLLLLRRREGTRNRKGINMTHEIGSNSSFSNPIEDRPRVASYDSGYEHSLGHYVEVKLLLQNTEEVPATFAAAS